MTIIPSRLAERRSEIEWLEVVAAANVNDALRFISSETFEVLLSDLHMPEPGNGLTVVSAMRHSNPEAVPFIFSGYPERSVDFNTHGNNAGEIVPPVCTKTLAV